MKWLINKNAERHTTNPNQYFKLMEETRKATYKKIQEYLHEYVKEAELKVFINKFIEDRFQNKRRLRALLVRGVYYALQTPKTKKQKPLDQILDLSTAFELWCVADYLTNDVFDSKLDKCRTDLLKDPNLFFMASAVMREVAEISLRTAAKRLNPKRESEAIALFNDLVRGAYHHQWVDYNLKYNDQTPQQLEEMLDDLFQRRYLDYETGNCFGKMCEISSILLGADEQERKALAEYGKNLSVSLQIVNDIADIAENNYDLKNRLLTYPLALTIVKTGKNVYDLCEEEVRKLFVSSGALDECRKKAIKIAINANKPLKKTFPKENRDLLASMLILAWSN
ncbi:polyprenyl synthetase family protein, partial [Candidatus Woesearchaeota archaeon]|nr:polyprenyl synthetase family protein [Candidatus Woesearchaeota archaeon]